ncbi:MAG: ROK family protein [Terriglobales bacterium]
MAQVNNNGAIGVDIGGTKIAAGMVGRNGKIEHQVRAPMNCHADAATAMAAVVSAIDQVAAKIKEMSGDDGAVRGIGICSPGPLDPKTGVVINPPNLPCWRNFPLAAEISRVYSLPVKLDNDANAAALAEALWGSGRDYRNVFYVTIGTGIGTGIVFDGQIYHGRTGAAGEGGHVTIDYRGPRCVCGKRGCIEVLASGPAIARRAQDKFRENPALDSAIRHYVNGNISGITSEIVGKAYSAGDRIALDVLRETIELLSVWLGNMVDVLEPDVIIVGGGVASILRPLLGEIRERIPACCVNTRCQEIPILPASYGVDSGIAGGAALI